MTISISISDNIFKRLEAKAIGFDTPERVIERLLDDNDQGLGNEKKPTIDFHPDEKMFKAELLVNKLAEIVLHMKDGSREVIQWNATRFKPTSSLRGNLWSGYLRGWKEKGIISAKLEVLDRGTSIPGDETNRFIAIANEISWTFDEVERYFIDIELISSEDDHPYYYLTTFDENVPDNLKEIAGLSDSYQCHLDLNFIGEEPELDDYE